MFKLQLGATPVSRSSPEFLRLVNFLQSAGPVTCITGAGVSTESGIPDYRSPTGSYSTGHKPMTHEEFMSNSRKRRRYWARSIVGWQHFSRAKPNNGHRAIAELHRSKKIHHLITQNVDRLHVAGGFPLDSLLELHGNNEEVICMGCSAIFPRREYQGNLADENAAWLQDNLAKNELKEVRADGDAEIDFDRLDLLSVPSCPLCGGVIKPNVVFFGGSVSKPIKDKSMDMIAQSNKLLLVGTTTSTWSCFRLCRQAYDDSKEVGILNVGPTRSDPLASFKVESPVGPTLQAVLEEIA